jgi:DNA-binding transcriptional LysR family regulator
VDHSSDDFRAIVALVAAGSGVALVPRSALHGAMLAGVAVRPLAAPAPNRRVFAALRRGSDGNPLLRLAVEAIRETARHTVTAVGS